MVAVVNQTISVGLGMLILILAAAFAPVASAQTIYFDDFSGIGDLNGVPPDIRPGAEAWSSTPGRWNADGTPTNVAGSANAFLPFVPTAGAVYMLSLDVDPDVGGTEWFAVGFTRFATDSDGFQSIHVNPGPWMLNRADDTLADTIRSFMENANILWANHDPEPDLVGSVNLKIVLDTRAANWTAAFFIDSALVRISTYAGARIINYVGMSEAGASGAVDNFTLTLMEIDSDSDGIEDDGDISYVVGDSPCTGGSTTNCDDNCPAVFNPDQADTDGDGIGDVCEAAVPALPVAGLVALMMGLGSSGSWLIRRWS